MQISGPDQGKLKQAILKGFGYFDFNNFLLERLDITLEHIATPLADFGWQVARVITYFNQNGWIPKLMSALIAERTSLTAFQELSYAFGLRPAIYSDDPLQNLGQTALEKLVNSDPLLDINVLIKNITDAKKCVCRIKVQNASGNAMYGTGFLVGEDLLLTNYHALEPVILDPNLAVHVICKFDYEVDDSGTTINPGTDVGLHANKPIEAYSPYCNFDVVGTPDVNVAWPPDQLDYALVRLAEKTGLKAYGLNAQKTSSSTATLRGWIKKSTAAPALFKGSNIIIVQHPDKQPMKIAIGLNKILGCDDNEIRVRYAINTMEGSSGSPCFDHEFNWIALHNMGDPNYAAKYNQGIPAIRIIEDLATRKINL